MQRSAKKVALAPQINLDIKIILPTFVSTKQDKVMKRFEITMKEMGKDGKVRTITQTALCESRKQVIDFYGLNEPDIISYSIKEI